MVFLRSRQAGLQEGVLKLSTGRKEGKRRTNKTQDSQTCPEAKPNCTYREEVSGLGLKRSKSSNLRPFMNNFLNCCCRYY